MDLFSAVTHPINNRELIWLVQLRFWEPNFISVWYYFDWFVPNRPFAHPKIVQPNMVMLTLVWCIFIFGHYLSHEMISRQWRWVILLKARQFGCMTSHILISATLMHPNIPLMIFSSKQTHYKKSLIPSPLF